MISKSITIAYIDNLRHRQLYTALSGEIVVIGKSSSATIQQIHTSSSEAHCRIRQSKSVNHWIVEDCGSATGTYLNNERISNARVLNNNDRLRLGSNGPILSVGFQDISNTASPQETLVSYGPVIQKSRYPSVYIILSLLIALLISLGITFFRSFHQGNASASNSSSRELESPSPIASDLCSGSSLETEELYNRLKPTVVQITTPSGTGSGVVIASGPFESSILTNHHVVEGYDRVTLLYPQNSSSSGSVLRVGGQEQLKDDLALISTSRGNLRFAKLSKQLSVGQTVFVIGSPALGGDTGEVLQWSLTKGIISNLDPAGEPGIFQTDAGINPGNSGGPVFNSQGCLVGLAVAVPSDRTIQQVGFGITSESINSFLTR